MNPSKRRRTRDGVPLSEVIRQAGLPLAPSTVGQGLFPRVPALEVLPVEGASLKEEAVWDVSSSIAP